MQAAASTGKYESQQQAVWGRQNAYVRSHASGANGTPMGTPARMSPVTTPPPVPTPAPAPVAKVAEKEKKAEGKKDKKRKSMGAEVRRHSMRCGVHGADVFGAVGDEGRGAEGEKGEGCGGGAVVAREGRGFGKAQGEEEG